MAEALQKKFDKNDSLTKTLRESQEELKRALKDGVKLIDSNRNLRFKISKIWSQLEAEKGENFTLQEYRERR